MRRLARSVAVAYVRRPIYEGMEKEGGREGEREKERKKEREREREGERERMERGVREEL